MTAVRAPDSGSKYRSTDAFVASAVSVIRSAFASLFCVGEKRPEKTEVRNRGGS